MSSGEMRTLIRLFGKSRRGPLRDGAPVRGPDSCAALINLPLSNASRMPFSFRIKLDHWIAGDTPESAVKS
jgi:hypothetical protein